MNGWLKLGKKSARPDAIKLKLAAIMPAAVPMPIVPPIIGKPWLVHQWDVLGNDSVGDCVWAGAAHETMLWRATAGVTVPFDDKVVVKTYSLATGYDPARPDTDQGTDMQAAAAWRQNNGIIDLNGVVHHIDAYASIQAGNVSQIALAVYLFGAAGVGIQLPASAMDQFDKGERWTVTAKSVIEGGHYVPVVGRNSHGDFLCVTWGRLHAVAPSFFVRYMDEGVAYLSFESVRNLSPDSEAQLRAQLAAVTSRINPKGTVMVDPVPPKTPSPQKKTTTALTSRELAAGTKAATAYLDKNVPSWERGFITAEMVTDFVAEVVVAVDKVRDSDTA